MQSTNVMTNQQAALMAAATLYAPNGHISQVDTVVTNAATQFLTWLNDNTPPGYTELH